MTIIDSRGWKEFLVSELFVHIERGRGSGAGSFSHGDVPYIAASFANNGYVRGVEDLTGELTSPGNCIAMIVNGNGGIGRNTYQSRPFVGSSDLQLGYHPKLNEFNGLFLVACLNKSIERYGYSFAWKRTGEAFARETVYLPQDSMGQPDWDYMERVMRNHLSHEQSRIEALQSLAMTKPHKVDISNWGDFRVKDLFDTIVRAKRRTITSYSEGDTPYVTNSTYNNGISAYVSPKDDCDIERGHCITVNTVDGSTFWQERDFLANSSGNGLLKLYRDGLGESAALFLCAAIKVSLNPTYAVMLTTDVVKELIIKLPQTASGAPDWEYMALTMETLLARQEANLGVLQKLSGGGE